ncbi:NCS2 family permease [Actinomadura kijaniata]|uniref:AGZA family xanthine/uracil permease-like MFS transporter n=1 Tax=Actinomadura namibiensis TaxID=182080 RepID=A0A7W3LJ89_ACTNM|nr:NCS2 family permease [Actinomadura namibiensis]MBA8949073.1 AGZA family xanthine/uracil permease-like MFS transporter [Actinomadura namibiensis]
MTETQAPPPKSPRPGPGPGSRSALDRFFDLSGRGTTVAREVRGGVTTFFAMAYLVILIPLIIGDAKDVTGATLNPAQLTTMVALSAGLTTILMGLVGNAPLAMAAGLGVTPIVVFQAAPHMTWPQAMGLVVLEGVIIVLFALTGIRQLIMDAIPLALKQAIGVGIGAFIALIGLVDAGFVGHHESSATPVTLGMFGKLTGWPVLVFCFGLILMLVLFVRRVPGAMLIGIVAATVFAVVVNSLVKVDPKAWGPVEPKLPGSVVATPDFGLLFDFDLIGGFERAGIVTASVVLFTLVLSGFFDAMGTILGVCEEARMLDENGRLPGLSKILTVDGFGAIIGGGVNGSANTAVVESAAGVAEGARTGLASVVTGGMLTALIFLTPLAGVVPLGAAAPALVLVGALMMTHVRKIDWDDLEIAVPAFLTVVLMPFTYSITVGVAAGVLSYTVIKLARGKVREIHWLLYPLSLIFVVYFALHPIESALGIK